MKHEHAFVRYWRALNASLEALGAPPVTLGEVSPLYEARVSLRAAVDILSDPPFVQTWYGDPRSNIHY